jgi:hypothetical protein
MANITKSLKKTFVDPVKKETKKEEKKDEKKEEKNKKKK